MITEREARMEQGNKCKWCRGSGRERVQGGPLSYPCPDCEGTGREIERGEDEPLD